MTIPTGPIYHLRSAEGRLYISYTTDQYPLKRREPTTDEEKKICNVLCNFFLLNEEYTLKRV